MLLQTKIMLKFQRGFSSQKHMKGWLESANQKFLNIRLITVKNQRPDTILRRRVYGGSN